MPTAFLGPYVAGWFRESSMRDNAEKLAAQVPDEKFEKKFVRLQLFL